MKRISFMIVAAGLLATSALVSCSKQEAKTSTTTSNPKNNAAALARMGGTWIKNVPNDDCKGTGTDCYELGPVVITPKVYGLIATAASSGNTTVVGTTFSSSDLQDFCDHLDATEAAKLQSGTYYLTLNNESSVAINYMVGTTFPVTAQNMEFAFQIRK